jgi:hypothetical protein
MHKLALVLLLCAGCVESTTGKDIAAPPTVVSPHIAGDPPTVTVKHETRAPVVRDYEPHAFPVSHHELVECWQCRR